MRTGKEISCKLSLWKIVSDCQREKEIQPECRHLGSSHGVRRGRAERGKWKQSRRRTAIPENRAFASEISFSVSWLSLASLVL